VNNKSLAFQAENTNLKIWNILNAKLVFSDVSQINIFVGRTSPFCVDVLLQCIQSFPVKLEMKIIKECI